MTGTTKQIAYAKGATKMKNSFFSKLGITLNLINHGVTLDELLEIWHYTVNEEGEIIDTETNKATNVWYDDLEREWNAGALYTKEA